MQKTSNSAYDYRAKIIVLGSTCVGKTSMLKCYCNNQYTQGIEMVTLGIDFRIKKVVVNEKVINLEIWDSSGLERFREITLSTLKGLSGVILTYSILQRDTFLDLQRYLDDLEDRGFGGVPKVLVGTNIDRDAYDPSNEDQELLRVISYDEAEEFAEKNGMLYFEVSARNGKNIEQPFEGLGGMMVEEWESEKKQNILKESFMLRNPGNTEHKNKQSKCSSCGP